MEMGRQLAVAAGVAVGAWLGRGPGGQLGWAAVGLAGSPWPRVTLEGGLWEAQQESRAGWPQTQAAPGLGVGLGGAPLQPSVHPQDPG